MQHWSWILYALFCLCHVIEDKCWKHSFKQSMKLKCTARKECIKYINESIYVKCFVPKMTPCGNIMLLKLTGKIQIVELCCLNEENGRADIEALFQMVAQHFGMKHFIYFSPHDMFHLYTMWVCLCLVCPINANLFLHNKFLASSFLFKETNWFGRFCATRCNFTEQFKQIASCVAVSLWWPGYDAVWSFQPADRCCIHWNSQRSARFNIIINLLILQRKEVIPVTLKQSMMLM